MLNERATGTVEGIGLMDHAVTSEYRIVGPPGTGKTRSISDQVRRGVEKYGSNKVLVASFSRAASAELANCDLPINPDMLGTLHSHCYQVLGRPSIAEAHVKEWNCSYPHLALTPVRGQRRLDGEDYVEDDAGNADRPGDSLLRELNRLRGLMVDPARWRPDIRDFERKWARYKRERNLLDFCDLIETCLREVDCAPNNPSALFVDEAQDLSVMQGRLVRRWGCQADYYVLAGDDDQTIYSFIGATPEVILEPDIPDDHKVILRQSYRVPRSIHQLADSLIRQVTRRQEKIYLPRPAAGDVQRLSTGTYRSPEYSILSSAVKHLERGKTIMFLASCSYMLKPLIQVLRKNAIPFHNPYRKANGFWNPLRLGRQTTGRRIISLLVAHPRYGEGYRSWTYADLSLWAEWLCGQGIFKAGAKKLLEAADRKETVTIEQLGEVFEAGPLASLVETFDGDWRTLLKWWRVRVNPEVRNRVQFPADVVSRRGPHSLIEEPGIVVGTVHSVKGGQADVVYLFPDLSRAGDSHYQVSGPLRDSVLRVFYVGATRARETLYICQRENAMAVSI